MLKVFDFTDHDHLVDFLDMWDNKLSVVNSMIAAVHQSSKDVVGHCVGKKRALVRDEKAAASRKQAQEIARVREDAKQAAEAIKAKHAPVTRKQLDP
eukprot:9559641-Lingulodinium_polyedra.AAC.1